MVDFTSTQAQAKELAPPVRQGEAQAEATVAKSSTTSPLLTADGVDRMFRQLAKFHAITAAQLVECARWHQTNSTPHSAQAGTSQPMSSAVPSMTRLAPSPPIDFSSQASLWPRQGQHNEPQVHCQPHQGNPSTFPSCCEQSLW
jgi:hypothetical protein